MMMIVMMMELTYKMKMLLNRVYPDYRLFEKKGKMYK